MKFKSFYKLIFFYFYIFSCQGGLGQICPTKHTKIEVLLKIQFFFFNGSVTVPTFSQIFQKWKKWFCNVVGGLQCVGQICLPPGPLGNSGSLAGIGWQSVASSLKLVLVLPIFLSCDGLSYLVNKLKIKARPGSGSFFCLTTKLSLAWAGKEVYFLS